MLFIHCTEVQLPPPHGNEMLLYTVTSKSLRTMQVTTSPTYWVLNVQLCHTDVNKVERKT